MKKLFLLSTLIISNFININSQFHKKGDFEFSIGTGLNSSSVQKVNSNDNTKSLISFNVGSSQEFYFSNRWGIKTKIIFDNKGWSKAFIEGLTSDKITTDFHLTYITIPVMANWHFGKTRRWYLHFGLYSGFLIKAKDSKLNLDLKELFNNTDFGLNAGIGHKFKINEKINFFIEYESQSGAIDIYSYEMYDSDITNLRTSFNIGLIF